MYSVWSARRLYNEFQTKPVSVQFSTSKYEDSVQFSRSSRPVPDKKWISDAARSTQARQRIGIRSTKEYKESAGDELTQCDYNKTESVISNCKFHLVYNQ
jgi:hypothetical protein